MPTPHTTDTLWHFGHAFSQAMPEIISVKGRPLADLLHPDTPTTLDAWAERMEQAIDALDNADIATQANLMPDGIDAKTHLLESLSGYIDAESDDDDDTVEVPTLIVGQRYVRIDDLTTLVYRGECDISDQHHFAKATDPEVIHLTVGSQELTQFKPLAD